LVVSGGPERLGCDYTVDAVGNPLQINDLLMPAQSRTYGYQDYQYFLTQGDGPWGTRSWTYDRIGNRLTETRAGVTDTYSYTGGNPKLQTVTQGGGAGTKYLAYDAAGNQIQDSRLHSELQLSYDAAGRMTRMEEATTETESFFLYDGRGFLREAREDLDLCSPMVTQATYSTEGVLLHRAHRNALTPAAAATAEAYVFYFAGRPVALLEGVLPAALTRKYLTVDHLGTPVLATSGAAVTLWAGGFEPFGADWSGGQAAGVFLRFPGQWEDGGWTLISQFYNNVHRWYTSSTGRYTRKDPINDVESRQDNPWFPRADSERFSLYSYVDSNPLAFIDPLGLFKFKGCTPERQAQISRAFKEYCAKIQSSDFGDCMCESPSIQKGLSRLCGKGDRTIRCQAGRTGRCATTPGYVSCGWSLPGGTTIRICEDAWTPDCGPLGCTLMHEMTHQLGHPREDKPEKVEKCLGCP
jgi:RHS repeat-associated protein